MFAASLITNSGKCFYLSENRKHFLKQLYTKTDDYLNIIIVVGSEDRTKTKDSIVSM